MSYNHNEEDWIVLVDEDGQEYRYSLERIMELEDKRYVILIPEIQENEAEEEAHVFRIELDENDEEVLLDVEDEELEKIQQLLEKEAFDEDFLDEDEEFDEDFLDDDEAFDEDILDEGEEED